MARRHFAYFAQADGSYLREQLADGPAAPAWYAWMAPALRRQLVQRWAHRLARPARGEVAIDVSSFDYPLGDFRWAVLRFGDGDGGRPLLDFPVVRTFMQIDRVSSQLVGWARSSRPIRSTANRVVLDVTGTTWEAVYGVFGQFGRMPGGPYLFCPDRATSPAALASAAESLSPYVLVSDLEIVEV